MRKLISPIFCLNMRLLIYSFVLVSSWPFCACTQMTNLKSNSRHFQLFKKNPCKNNKKKKEEKKKTSSALHVWQPGGTGWVWACVCFSVGVKARSTHGEMRVLLNRGVWHSVSRQVLLSARNDWCLPTHTAAKVMADVIYPPIHPSIHPCIYFLHILSGSVFWRRLEPIPAVIVPRGGVYPGHGHLRRSLLRQWLVYL